MPPFSRGGLYRAHHLDALLFHGTERPRHRPHPLPTDLHLDPSKPILEAKGHALQSECDEQRAHGHEHEHTTIQHTHTSTHAHAHTPQHSRTKHAHSTPRQDSKDYHTRFRIKPLVARTADVTRQRPRKRTGPEEGTPREFVSRSGCTGRAHRTAAPRRLRRLQMRMYRAPVVSTSVTGSGDGSQGPSHTAGQTAAVA